MSSWGCLTEEEQERYTLAYERIMQIPAEAIVQDPGRGFFQNEARFLLRMEDLRQALEMDAFDEFSEEEWRALNRELYEEILPENYSKCYGNPDMACEVFGREIGQMISFLYTELRGAVVFAFEDRERDMLLLMELFLQVYAVFAGNTPDAEQLHGILYWYASDYCEQFADDRTRELIDPSLSFLRDIVMDSDLSDLRYLYRYGEYITENETGMAAYLNTLPESEIEAMARTWTEGYRIGFEVQGKDLSQKKTAVILYRVGFERMVRAAIGQLKELGLESILYRPSAHVVNRRSQTRGGCYGAVPNPQFDYDHRNDAALFTDSRFVTRRLQALQNAYESRKELAAVHAGPLVLEVFGENPFKPQAKDTVLQMTEEQQKEQLRYVSEAGQITNRYIKGEERSFTIISYPVPGIGKDFPEIFRETIRINNLDYQQYQRIQQYLIDALDKGFAARVCGGGKNETELTVMFHELTDPSKQTNFENCVADVNIPVGEVFTSPVLEGTNGLLHVCSAALEGFRFEDLRIRIENGMVKEYSCANFEDPEKGRKYIEENILFRHPTLPVGEFAIGTNTTAYAVGQKYHIAEILPILIAEKTGPHFAFGDTCYSRQEDIAVFNPDGKEIIARDNEQSVLRKENPEKAYYNCHTDITIPYNELGSIRVLCRDGSEIPLLENGRFVLPGTEELNKNL